MFDTAAAPGLGPHRHLAELATTLTDVPKSPRNERRYGGQPVIERSAQRRARLREAALDVFYEHGYPASSVATVCRRAGLSTRQFYEEFDDKEALLTDLYDRCNADAQRAVLSSLAESSGSFADRLHDAIRAYTTALVHDFRVVHLTVVTVVGVSEAFEDRRSQQREQWIESLNSVARASIDSGEIADRDYSYAWIALMGAINALGASALKAIHTPGDSLDSMLQAVDQMLWGGLLATGRQRGT